MSVRALASNVSRAAWPAVEPLERRTLLSGPYLIGTPSAGGAIFDHARNRVYVPSGGGNILRFDLNTKAMLAPWTGIGGNLGGGDITPDGKFLYVADGVMAGGSSMVHKITIDTGAVKHLPYTLNYDDSAKNVVVADGKAWVGHYGQWGALRAIDLANDAYTTPGPNLYGGFVVRGKSRTTLWSSDDGSSPSTGAVYDAGSNTWTEKWSAGSTTAAVSPNGAEVALGEGFVNNKLVLLRTAPQYRMNVGYDPDGSTLYTLDDAANKVVAVNPLNGAVRFSFGIADDVSTYVTSGRAFTGAASDDGRWLLLTGSAGVRVYDLTPYKPAATGSIAGNVFDDLDADGVKDAGEVALANWKVFLDADKDGVLDSGEKTASTDSAGNYKFGGLAAGSHRVREVLSSGWRRTGPASDYYDVTLSSAQVVTGKHFGNTQKVLISGTVWNDLDGDGIKEAGEGGLANRKIFLDADKDGVWDAAEKYVLSDPAGNYSFKTLAAGSYRVREVLPSGWRRTAPSASYHDFTLSNGASATGKNFGSTQKILIAGTVFQDLDGDRIKDAGEGGLSGRRVFIDSDGDGQWDSTEKSVLTDSAGNWKFTALSAGTYRVRVAPVAGWKLTTPTAGYHAVTLSSAGTGTGKLFGQKRI